MPHLAKTQMEYIDKNVQIISISDEKMETITEFLDREIAEAKKSKKEVASDEKDADGSAAKRPKETYRELTSAYCLTTDPDRSVSTDYMKAAGQNGIPTCFIVGKSGEIEWIGHPMGMDEPLAKVVDGSWDRAAYLVEYKKSKDRELMMSAIMQKMRQGDSEGALKQISEAKKTVEGDAKSLAMLDQMMLNVIVTPAMKKVRAGDIEGGLEMLNELSKSLSPDQQALLGSVKFRLNMQANHVEAAEESLKKMIDTENVAPQTLNAAAWDVYQAAKEDREFSKPLLAAAVAAAEKAVTKAPNNGAILDTLAHLFHLQGDLERAIELQTKAMQNAGTAETEIQAYLDQLKAEKAGK
jgi:hypothetical protein